MNISKLLAIILIAMAALFIHGLAFCVDVPNTPLDVEGTDPEYRDLLGVWKGSWVSATEHIILIYKVSDGQIFMTQAFVDKGKETTQKRVGEIYKENDVFFFKYTTGLGTYNLSCKKGATTMSGRRTGGKSPKDQTIGAFHKME
jgi:hypothetical protein